MNKRLTRFSWFVLGYNILVILWGAFVRATGSGAGCGANWPLCGEELFPRNPQVETMIEFGHRVSSGLALVFVVILFIWVLRRFAKGNRVRKAAIWSLIFIILEALIGAGLVLFELTAGNQSAARAVSISVHLVNTFLLLGALTLTAWWSEHRDQNFELDTSLRTISLVIGLLGITLVGMTGAITALGDTLFPSSSLMEGIRQDLSPTAHFLIRLRVWHPILSVISGIYLVFIAGLVIVERKSQRIHRFGWGLIGLVTIQLLAGIINLVLLAPLWMQIVHLLLADLVWITLVLFSITLISEPEIQMNTEAVGVGQEIS